MKVEMKDGKFQPIPGSEFDLEADLILLVMGIVSTLHDRMVNSLGVEVDAFRRLFPHSRPTWSRYKER